MAEALTLLPPAAAAFGTVKLSNVSKTFRVSGKSVHALDSVSLSIDPGEFLSIIGPSGCGKSTILRFLAGLDRPDEGEILVDGKAIGGPGLQRGIVFQDHRLLPWLNVERNIGLALHALPGSPDEKAARVSELIALVGLRGFEKALPHQLSGGMSQRAAIARGLAPRPPLLLLDEPLGALDSLTRARLQEELLDIWRGERITVVMVTHDVEEAVFLSDRIVVMEPRPGRVRSILSIGSERPRRRSAPDFVAARREIDELLNHRT